MKILAFGDIYGRIGRRAFLEYFPLLKREHNPDFTIVNIDNITSGRGVVEKHAKEIEAAGVDVMTGGDHIIDNLKNITDYLDADNSPLLRPANLWESSKYVFPWVGHKLLEKNWKKLLIIHLLGHAFMDKFNARNAFLEADAILDLYKDREVNNVIIDFHKEATAEIQWLARYLDGRVSAVFWTHTHVQTNDDIILPKGTGLLWDVWMNGPLNSVIGAEFGSVKRMFLTGIFKWKIEQSLDPHYLINAVLFELDDAGKCISIEKIKATGVLS